MAFPNNFKRNGKYNAHKVEYRGVKFDSERERDRFIFLEDCQRRGLIAELQRQVKFVLFADEYKDVVTHLKTKDRIDKRLSYRGIKYVADFQYWHVARACHVVEDVKGVTTPEYELKEKLMHFLKGIDVVRVTKPRQPV